MKYLILVFIALANLLNPVFSQPLSEGNNAVAPSAKLAKNMFYGNIICIIKESSFSGLGSTISYERLWWANKQQTLLVSSSFSAAVGTHLSVGRKVYAEIGVIYPLLSSSLAPELGIRYQGSGKSPFIKLYGWRLWHLGKNSEESPRILGGLAVGYAF